MNAALYKEILEDNLLQSVQQLRLHRGLVFQQDNNPKHTAKVIKAWFGDNNIDLLEWPSQSPDLNPIENLWAELKRQVRARSPKTLDDLGTCCMEEWDNIPAETCANAVVNYRKRLVEVTANKGHAIEIISFLIKCSFVSCHLVCYALYKLVPGYCL